MRILITGIEGFVGRHLAAHLAGKGHAVRGTTLGKGVVVEGAEELSALDVREPDRVRRVMEEARPEAVVHLAGQASGAEAIRHPEETFAINAGGALHVLEACRDSGVEKVLLVTSSEVYGRGVPDQGPVTESSRIAPVTPYGVSKAAQDLMGFDYWRSHGVPVVRVRAFPHTGAGQDPKFVFPSIARRIALAEAGRGSVEIEVGDLGVTRDFSDVRDVVRAYEALIEKGRPGEAYNVCSGVGRTIAEWLEAMQRLAKLEIRLEEVGDRVRPIDVRWMVGDATRLRDVTGWRPRIRWDETVRDVLEDWRVRVTTDEGEGETVGQER